MVVKIIEADIKPGWHAVQFFVLYRHLSAEQKADADGRGPLDMPRDQPAEREASEVYFTTEVGDAPIGALLDQVEVLSEEQWAGLAYWKRSWAPTAGYFVCMCRRAVTSKLFC
jgi:hypothetical protein